MTLRVLVTGAAGFIGSHLCERLVEDGHDVVGVDCFTSSYDPNLKRSNLAQLTPSNRFRLAEIDLRRGDLSEILRGHDVIYHLAAIPGVRASWSDGFASYAEHNILATQRLLEATRGLPTRIVYASSSSVYGNADTYPVTELSPTRPVSPYGVSKLAGELLCQTYALQFGLDVVMLRYFSVYGPRQRPDMGLNRIIDAAMSGGNFTVFGTGAQVRDMTFVRDVIDATTLAGSAEVDSGTILNIAGGETASVNDLLDLVAAILDVELTVIHASPQDGDPERTGGDISRASAILNWSPTTELRQGVEEQVQWQSDRAAVKLERSDTGGPTSQ